MSNLNQLADEDLMKAYQNGNEAAFAVLYGRYSGKAYGFLQAKLRNRAEVDDVFQATFLKLHQSRSHYDPSYPFAPWLFTVCRSVLLDHVRKKARSHEDISIEAQEAIAPEVATESAHILPGLGLLAPNQKQAIELRYGAELSFDEIARRLETSPSNVRQLISRGLKRLRLVSLGKESK